MGENSVQNSGVFIYVHDEILVINFLVFFGDRSCIRNLLEQGIQSNMFNPKEQNKCANFCFHDN
jgi:hypothetical protein